MARRKVQGTCRLCGAVGKLSFEHVPPESAFNNGRKFYEATLEDLFAIDESFIDQGIGVLYKDKKARLKQGGIGAHTLCVKCNNSMGRWYGEAYMDWTYQAMGILLKANGKPSQYYPVQFYPLRIIKQVFAMFFSLNSEYFHKLEPALQRFILNREESFLDSRYQIYAYYNIEGSLRYIGGNAVADFGSGSLAISHISELCFPPFGFVMTLDSNTPDRRLTNITHFTRYGYNDKLDYYQRFAVLPTYLPHIPGDYRTRDEILRTIQENKALGDEVRALKLKKV